MVIKVVSLQWKAVLYRNMWFYYIVYKEKFY
jgi:hypothetical protein